MRTKVWKCSLKILSCPTEEKLTIFNQLYLFNYFFDVININIQLV